MNSSDNNGATRRQFLGASAATAMATATGLSASALAVGPGRVWGNADKIKIGLVGCGGRGTGAAAQALHADPGVVLVSIGDVLKSAIDRSVVNLKAETQIGDRVQVTQDNMFVGLDAYKKVIDSGVDVVLLTTPPGFRPLHIKYAVEANKHVFAEKPMGTDTAGVHMALESVKLAKQKKLNFVAGFCWRYDYPRREFFRRLHDGAIGDIRHIHATYLTSPVKPMPAPESRPTGMSDTEWQIRNWYNFTYLSGDGLVEQACHSVDKILWTMKDVPPLRCVATGSRLLPNNEGNIYDHIDVFYEWADGTRATMAQRQIPCQYNDNSDYVAGAKGHGYIKGPAPTIQTTSLWKYSGPDKNMYQVEHDEMYAAIRKGTVINDGERMWRSTLAGLMGRMAAYTGQEITWEQMLASRERLVPENMDWNSPLAIAPMAVAGKTPFV
ncbi:MAG: Gfo/Idh/MocA family oxidoreductase [Chthonomonadales bacterium]